ncbi:cleft lip and palate transmembrane 1 [Teratosphaeria nubilosa]|uniref:Cleft lip and palate transmembrane 1 n=1 Tax=Teratosphaeria nubilosa TaxID=161662 RepID=A0A6G1LD59_9PEZI|nr:cleft lip and palate transmembrane 1 [Teratosphaeria nubilosa]
MPEGRAGVAAPAEAEQSWINKAWPMLRNIAMFMAVQYLISQWMGWNRPASTPVPDAAPADVEAVDAWNEQPVTIYPLWPSNTSVDVSLYISPSIVMPRLSSMPADSLIVDEKDFALDRSKKDLRSVHRTFKVPKEVQNNGTLWAHIFVAQSGFEKDPASPVYDPTKAYRMTRPLTQYLAKKKVRKTRNLLESKNETGADLVVDEVNDTTAPTIASYYHPNFTLSFIDGAGNPALTNLHPAMAQFYTLGPGRDATGKGGYYYPILYLNTFWQLKSHMTELNSTHPISELPINVDVSPLANWQFSIMASMDEGMKETARKSARGESTPGGGDGSELELIKETLLDTNPWLLGTTGIVSIFHMIFEMLAFKSDVGHWRKKKDNVGVSVRTILSNVVMQLIIFLYLFDNNDSTSWMILFGQGMGILIEAWKVTKTVDVRIRQPAPGTYAAKLGLPYTVVLEDKHKLSETEEKTEEYDRIAFKYMGIIAVPLLLAYAAYSLIYESHKSWYSFIITTLVGSVYAYGFLMMVPSLYINYRLKSVAHMPGRAMAYKFLNTFIDDLFAFTIKMPILHRLATFRDDIIFFIYLYQAWAYKVDYSRVNEFGQGGDEEEAEEKVKDQPLSSVAGADGKVALKEVKDAVGKAGKAVSSGASKGSAKMRKG